MCEKNISSASKPPAEATTTGHPGSTLGSWAGGVNDGAEAREADGARLRDGHLGAAIVAIPCIVRRSICNGS
jgi:hypothetical protein